MREHRERMRNRRLTMSASASMRWTNGKVLVLGLGDTGLSMARWLRARGARVRVADTRAAPPQCGAARARTAAGGARVRRHSATASLRAADLIAISPGVDRRVPAIAAAIAARHAGGRRRRAVRAGAAATAPIDSRAVIAITGTNGKSTVTQMAGDICAAAGCDTVVAGNIGTAGARCAGARSSDGGAMPECSCWNCRASSWRARRA